MLSGQNIGYGIIATIVVFLFMFSLGFLVKIGKAPFLIKDYTRMKKKGIPKEDLKDLCNHVGYFMMFISVVISGIFIGNIFSIYPLYMGSVVLFFISTIAMAIYMNTAKKFKKAYFRK